MSASARRNDVISIAPILVRLSRILHNAAPELTRVHFSFSIDRRVMENPFDLHENGLVNHHYEFL